MFTIINTITSEAVYDVNDTKDVLDILIGFDPDANIKGVKPLVELLKYNSSIKGKNFFIHCYSTDTNCISNPTRQCMKEFNADNLCWFNESEGNNWMWNFSYFRFNMDGSITCRASVEALKCAETQSLAVALLWENCLDAQLVGEDGCVNNWDMYTPIYFPNIGLAFNVYYSDSEKFKSGEEVTIYGYEPTKEDLQDMIEWWEEH